MKSQSNSSQNGSKGQSKSTSKKAKPDAAQGLRDLLTDGLKDLYWAEKALVKSLPKMASNATSEELASAVNEHLEITKQQVARLEEVFAALGEKAQAKKCPAMAGLIEEAEEIMEETEEGVVRDAAIIAAAQKVEHYEIASYGTLAAFAKTLGEQEATALLEETLTEEKDADQTLSEIAESSINLEAAEADSEEGEEDEMEETGTGTSSRSKK